MHPVLNEGNVPVKVRNRLNHFVLVIIVHQESTHLFVSRTIQRPLYHFSVSAQSPSHPSPVSIIDAATTESLSDPKLYNSGEFHR